MAPTYSDELEYPALRDNSKIRLAQAKKNAQALVRLHGQRLFDDYSKLMFGNGAKSQVQNEGKWRAHKRQFAKIVIAQRVPAILEDGYDLNALLQLIDSVVHKLAAGGAIAAPAKKPRRSKDVPVDVDAMSGQEFEKYCEQQLIKARWRTEATKKSGDQGVDILARKGKYCVAVQCKRFSGSVGNAAVQEVLGGRLHYSATHAVVVSNANFTRSAKDLAFSAGVTLIHYQDLPKLEELIHSVG